MTVLAATLSPLGQATRRPRWTPAVISTFFWLDSSELSGTDGDRVGSMPDRSGSGLTFTSSGNNRPTLRPAAQNGKTAIETVGPGQGLSVNRSFTPSIQTAYFMVVKRTTSQHYNWLHEFPNDDINCLYTPSPTGDGWNIYNPGDSAAVNIVSGWNLYSFGFTVPDGGQWPTKWARRNGGESSNSVALGGNPVNTARAGFVIGTRGLGGANYSWTGQIGEYLMVNGAVSDSDRDRIEGYLAHKWGLAGSLPGNHAYKGAAP